MSAEGNTYAPGDRPGKGVYACRECGRHVTVRSDEDELPSCELCEDGDEVTYVRVS